MATGKSIAMFDIKDVSGGCNYSDDIMTVAKNQSPDSLNVEFFNGRIRKRPGERTITTLPSYSGSITTNLLIVGGGGGGGGLADGGQGGGGGAGGYLEGTYSVASGASISVVVGAGGAHSTNGDNSSFDGIIALGGGGGASPALSGGSGAGGFGVGAGTGGTGTQTSVSGLTAYKSDGGAGYSTSPNQSGGGGGGAVGTSGFAGVSGQGGAGAGGRASSITGASVVYAAGGGGGTRGANAGGVGGTSNIGGHGGGLNDDSDITAGTTNTGSGGGGAGNVSNGAAGGSGIVIVSYATPSLDNGTGGTITHSGGNTIHSFTSSGTFTAPTTTSTNYIGYSLVDFSNVSDKHRQIAHIGSGVFSFDRLTNVSDTLRTGTPYARSFNAKVSSYLIQTYSDYSAPYYWDGSATTMTTVSANAPGFKRAVEYQGYLIGMNTSTATMRCYYQPISNLLGGGAAYTDYFTLTPAPNDDEISDPFILNGRLYAGTKTSIFRISFVGGVTVFEFKQVVSDIGVVPNTSQVVVTKEFGQVVIFLGTDKRIYLFDGSNVKSVSDLFYFHNKTTPISLDLLDDNYIENSYAVYDPTRRIYRLWCTKLAETRNKYCLNIDVDTFAYYPFDNMVYSCGYVCQDDRHRPSVICIDYNGLLHKMFIDNPTDNGTAINEYYTSPVVSKQSSAIKKGGTINLHITPVSNASLIMYEKVDFRRAWTQSTLIPLASPRDKFLGVNFILGSSLLGSEKDILYQQVDVGASFNDYQFKLKSNTPTSQQWEILDLDVSQEVLRMGRAEAQR